MTEALAEKVRCAPNLPSLPAIAIQVLDLAQKPEVDIAEIARTISKDPALSGKILRTVNSSFYGRSNNVSTISHALVILGLQSVKTLVLGFSLVSHLTNSKSRGFNHIRYWKHSIFAATAARTLAARISFVQQEEAFLAALLGDIGMLALSQIAGEEYGAIHDRVGSYSELCAAEQQALGVTHAEVGGLLAEMWKLPAILSVPIAQHHTPENVKDGGLRRLTELVSLAGRCADVFVDEQAAPAIADVRQRCLEQHKMTDADCDTILADIGKRTKEVANLFEINIGSVEEYEAVLKRANETLVAITLQTQQHVSSLAEQAVTLAQQNQQLHQQASTDALTGLANRAKFDQFLAEQFRTAVHEGKNLALLMIDLDRFKSVNDRLGHLAGDALLKAVSRILQASVREQDLAARYGGEEFTLVIPDASRAAAATLAETVRRTIASKPIPTGKAHVKMTASVGVAIYEPGSPMSAPAHLLKAADLAMYNAKHSGRNCTKVLALNPCEKSPASPAEPDPSPGAALKSAAAALHADANALEAVGESAAPVASATLASVASAGAA